jgi:Sulfotransferase family
MGPVFLFGTGRCGSTHLQRLITLNSDVWVWGEHDGFLEPLLKGLSVYEDSSLLRSLVFDWPFPKADAQLIDLMRRDWDVPWLNRLRPSDLRVELRRLIEGLFSRPIPQGYSSWGFKEPRYGGPNNVPAYLLDLFPQCSMAFIFREPSATIASQLRSWFADQLEPERLGELPGSYEGLVRSWVGKMEYFVGFKRTRPDSIVMLELRQLDGPPEQILELLRLQPRRDVSRAVPNITNRGPATASQAAERAMAICFERWRRETTALYEAALALCDPVP